MRRRFRHEKNGREIINRGITINDQVNGIAWVVFREEELQTAGLFKAEFVVTWPDGQQESFPNDDYLEVLIRKNI